jgi:hypothetical protein
VPEHICDTHLSKVGLSSSAIDAAFVSKLYHSKLSKKVRRLYEDSPESIESVRSRVRLASVSWTWLRDQLAQIESNLDCSNAGEQTLFRLLSGFLTQIEAHGKTGITKLAP